MPDLSFVQSISPYVQCGHGQGIARNYQSLQLIGRFLVDTIASELRSEKYIFLDWPAHPNIGDQAIYAGTAYLLNKLLNAKCVYASSFHEFDAGRMSKVREDVPVLFHGGGNLGDLWPEHQAFRESVLRQFPERRFILLPQTMHFEKRDELDRVGKLFRAQPRFTIFLRDWTSYKQGVELFGMERVRLAPDMVFSLIGLMPRLIAAMRVAPDVEELHLRRTDKESTGEVVKEIEDARICDWPQHETLGILKTLAVDAKKLSVQCGWPKATVGYFPNISWHHFLAGVQTILQGRRIVTDRLHGHIFAALCGKPHTFLANANHKNRAFFDTWTAGLDDVQFGNPRKK